MSERRVIAGVSIGFLLLALGLLAVWYWSLPLSLAPVVLLGGSSILGGFLAERRRDQMLQPYWDRFCMGLQWRRRFPESPRLEIRKFLNVFLDAFGFPARRSCCFSPDDKVLEVYHALYPPGDALADCFEIETLTDELQKHYRIDLVSTWTDDITLGELYARTQVA